MQSGSLDGFRKFIKETKESKMSSPSGRHYGHYKAWAEDEELSVLAFDIIECALRNGIVLERWKTVHQLLLLKDDP